MRPDHPRPPLRPWLVLVATLPALALAAVQASWPWPFVSDDAFISMRYAERLLLGHGLTWTDGEAVEGYSNLLWVLATAGLGALGLDLLTAVRGLGALGTAAALWFCAAALRPHDARSTLVAAAPCLLVASCAPVMAWTLGGLEGPMVLLWLAWGLAGVLRRLADGAAAAWLPAGVPFALLCLTRPDGPLWAAAAGLPILLATRGGVGERVRRAAAFGLLPGAAVLGQLLFRLAYHGDIVPNTAHAKLAATSTTLQNGAEYVAQGLWVVQGLAWLAATGLVAALWRRADRGAAAVLLATVLTWLAYLVAIGGDHFGGYRLLHGALVPMALLAGLGVRAFAASDRRAVLASGCVLLGAAGNVALSRTDMLAAYVRTETFEWQGKVLGETFARAFAGRRPLLAVDAAGALPYYSQLPALDMLGLCDRTIAATPTPAWATAAATAGGLLRPQGHMRGNGGYVMDRQPDLMMFAPPPGLPLPVFLSGLELEYDRRFLDGYRCVVLETPPVEWMPGVTSAVVASFWVRVEGRAGAVRTADRIEVPAFLLGAFQQRRPIQCRFERPVGTPEALARNAAEDEAVRWFFADRFAAAVPAADGALHLELRAHKPARLELAVPPGTWRLELQPAGTGLTAALEGANAVADGTFAVTPDAGVTAIAVTAPPGAALPVRMAGVVLHRTR